MGVNIFSYFINFRFILMVLIGSVAGLFVGAIPGLSVSMATALLVSITYSWSSQDAIATVMGVYVVGVFSGALSAILVNIPGAPSSVVTTIDGYPLAKKGEAYKALKYATVYSVVGGLIGLFALWFLAKPISNFALMFTPMDYFLLAFFGLTAVGSLSSNNFSKGLLSAMLGLLLSMIGIDSVVGIPRLTFGIRELQTGINIVPTLIGLFGFSEILSEVFKNNLDVEVSKIPKQKISLKEILKHFFPSLYYGVIGTLVGALPGAGGPVASFLAYSEAKKRIKNPSTPFGEGAIEGIVASETANNACIGGALIPMLTLAIPGDAVTAIILSVFYVHGLRPGPMLIKTNPEMFYSIVASGLISCVFLLFLGLLVAPRIAKLLSIPKKILLPIIAVLCVIGSFSCNNRLFDVILMIFFGILGFIMKRKDYPTSPMTLALVLGGMIDSNFRRAISLASSEDNKILALFGRPITIILLALIIITILKNIPFNKKTIKK